MAEYVGLIPAAGTASRLQGLPKMLLPVGETFLLKRMVDLMNVPNITILANKDNYRLIADHIWSGDDLTIIGPGDQEPNPKTYCETLFMADADDKSVLFGMPDTYFEDETIFLKLRDVLEGGADVAVGVFRTRYDQRSKLGMVHLDGKWGIVQVYDKPDRHGDLLYAWGVLAWKPEFWQYIQAADLHLGLAMNRAINLRLRIEAVEMQGQYWDCGTWEEYAQLCAYLLEKRTVEA